MNRQRRRYKRVPYSFWFIRNQYPWFRRDRYGFREFVVTEVENGVYRFYMVNEVNFEVTGTCEIIDPTIVPQNAER